MTLTSLTWIALVLGAAGVGVRTLATRRTPARVHPDEIASDEDWRPRVSSGCGR